MNWLKIDVDNLYKWRKRVDRIILPTTIICLTIVALIIILTPFRETVNNMDPILLVLLVISPVFIFMGGGTIAVTILNKIAYKACKFQVKYELYEILQSEVYQYIALGEQAIDGGYPDDEYIENFIF